MAQAELVKAIREAGREPVQRDSLYRRVDGKMEEWKGEEYSAPGGRALPAELAGAGNEGGAA
jgi:hypothetical protein